MDKLIVISISIRLRKLKSILIIDLSSYDHCCGILCAVTLRLHIELQFVNRNARFTMDPTCVVRIKYESSIRNSPMNDSQLNDKNNRL